MNKKFILLPAAMLMLAACGGASSSVASSTPASSTTTSSATSLALDTNIYSVVGAFQGWNPADENTVMDRASGTNNYSLTLDLYQDTQWKLVINQSWDAGQVSPSSPGVSVQEDGTTIADFVNVGGTNMEAVGDGFDGYNFNTLVHGNYTINFTSLPALNRVLNIVRNGDPIVPPPTDITWYLVGNFTEPQWGDGFVEANEFVETSTPGTYERTLDLLEGYEFKVVKMVGTTPTWIGASILGDVTPVEYADAVGGSDNFIVATNGNYKLTLIDGATDVLNVERLGDPIVAPPTESTYFLRGSIGDGDGKVTEWGADLTAWELVEDANVGSFEIILDLYVGNEFKVVKNGLTWMGATFLRTFDDTQIGGSDNISVLAEGNYKVALVAGDTDVIDIYRLGDATVPGTTEVDPADWFLVGSVTDPAWTPSDKSLPLTAVEGQTGVYAITLELDANQLFKVKTGTTWETGRDLGFGAVTAAPGGAFGDDFGNIKVLADGKYTITFTFAPSAGSISITASGWIGYGMGISEPAADMTMTYAGITGSWWEKNAQLNLASFDGTKTGITFAFTGVAGHEYLFKIEGAGAGAPVELAIVGDGNAQTLTLDLSAKTEAERANLKLIVLFVKTLDASGSITVQPFTYVS